MRRRPLVPCALLAGLVLPAIPATVSAQQLEPWTFRLEAGAGTMLRDFDHSDIDASTPAVVGTARLALRLGQTPLALQLGGAYGRFLRPNTDSVGLININLGLRLEPQVGTVGRFWIDVNGGASIVGDKTAPGLDAGLGFEFHVASIFSMGPYARFGYIFNGRDGVQPINTNVPQTQLSLSANTADLMYWHAGLTFAFHTRVPAPPPVADRDHDGTPDPQDLCADVPAGPNPDPARRGCPLVDGDGDGVFDVDDACPTEPAGAHPDANRRGCPTADTDHDGVLDPQDLCPNEPAGPHPNPERAGCADGDRDHDGVTDHADQCPDEVPGLHPDPARPGCALPDRDHDSVPDATDHCPDQPGAPSQDPNRNGCPGLVLVTEGQIHINRPVFFGSNSDVVLSTSFPVLTAVAEALHETPGIRHISVQGHTDDVGDDAANLDLSRRRAESVVRFLTQHGVDAPRLSAVGYGESHPLVQSTAGAARAQNRRVEFHIVNDASEVPPPPTAPAAPAPAAAHPAAPAAAAPAAHPAAPATAATPAPAHPAAAAPAAHPATPPAHPATPTHPAEPSASVHPAAPAAPAPAH